MLIASACPGMDTSLAPPAEGTLDVAPLRSEATGIRSLVDQAFERASGAQLIPGNRVRLLRDADENYPAWLDAIASAREYLYFESYIIRDDVSGRQFSEALRAKAREGVRVRLLYDWLGAIGKTAPGFWSELRDAGIEVRCFNPFRFTSPLGWIRRDHRKCLVDAMAHTVARQSVDLCLRLRAVVRARAVRPTRQRRGGVVHRGLGAVRPAHRQAAGLKFGEGLRRGDFVDQVQVDVQHRGRGIAFGLDQMGVPQLLEQGLGGDVGHGRGRRQE